MNFSNKNSEINTPSRITNNKKNVNEKIIYETNINNKSEISPKANKYSKIKGGLNDNSIQNSATNNPKKYADFKNVSKKFQNAQKHSKYKNSYTIQSSINENNAKKMNLFQTKNSKILKMDPKKEDNGADILLKNAKAIENNGNANQIQKKIDDVIVSPFSSSNNDNNIINNELTEDKNIINGNNNENGNANQNIINKMEIENNSFLNKNALKNKQQKIPPKNRYDDYYSNFVNDKKEKENKNELQKEGLLNSENKQIINKIEIKDNFNEKNANKKNNGGIINNGQNIEKKLTTNILKEDNNNKNQLKKEINTNNSILSNILAKNSIKEKGAIKINNSGLSNNIIQQKNESLNINININNNNAFNQSLNIKEKSNTIIKKEFEENITIKDPQANNIIIENKLKINDIKNFNNDLKNKDNNVSNNNVNDDYIKNNVNDNIFKNNNYSSNNNKNNLYNNNIMNNSSNINKNNSNLIYKDDKTNKNMNNNINNNMNNKTNININNTNKYANNNIKDNSNIFNPSNKLSQQNKKSNIHSKNKYNISISKKYEDENEDYDIFQSINKNSRKNIINNTMNIVNNKNDINKNISKTSDNNSNRLLSQNKDTKKENTENNLKKENKDNNTKKENKENINIFRELSHFVSTTVNKLNKYSQNKSDAKKDSFFEEIVSNNNYNFRGINPKILLKNIISGVPNRYRGRFWLKCIGNQLSITPDYFNINLYKYYEINEDSKTIKYKLPFPYLGIFKEETPLTSDLVDVINGFVISRPDIKYNEKISYLVGMLIINMDKYQAYVSFMNLILNPNIIIYYLDRDKDENIMEYGYTDTPGRDDNNEIKPKKIPSIVEKNLRRVIFKQLLFHNLPDLCSHLELLSVLPEHYFDEWNKTIFCKNFNIDIAMKIWDLFVVQGEKVVFDAGIALMKELQNDLLDCEEKEEVLDILLNSQLREINESNVLKEIQSVEYPDWIQSEVQNMSEETVIPISFKN